MREALSCIQVGVLLAAARDGDLPADRDAGALFQHAESCAQCAHLFDSIQDETVALAIYRAAANETDLIDEAIVEFESDRRARLQAAVRDVLLASLGSVARVVAGVDPLLLVDAIEAVSLLVYREARRERISTEDGWYRTRHSARLHDDGHLTVGSRTFPKRELILQIAHLAELTPATSEAVSLEKVTDAIDAERLASWMFSAVTVQPLLFPHLEARVRGRTWVALEPLVKDSRILDPGVRWLRGVQLATSGQPRYLRESENRESKDAGLADPSRTRSEWPETETTSRHPEDLRRHSS